MVSVLDSSVIDHGLQKNCIGGVMISVLDSSVIDHRCVDSSYRQLHRYSVTVLV